MTGLRLQASALPPKIAAAGKEELQKMLMDSLRKLKARDKKLAELKAENDGHSRLGPQENGTPNSHLKVLSHPVLEATTVASMQHASSAA